MARTWHWTMYVCIQRSLQSAHALLMLISDHGIHSVDSFLFCLFEDRSVTLTSFNVQWLFTCFRPIGIHRGVLLSKNTRLQVASVKAHCNTKHLRHFLLSLRFSLASARTLMIKDYKLIGFCVFSLMNWEIACLVSRGFM